MPVRGRRSAASLRPTRTSASHEVRTALSDVVQAFRPAGRSAFWPHNDNARKRRPVSGVASGFSRTAFLRWRTSYAGAGRRSAASLRPTRTSAWQNASPAISVTAMALGPSMGSRGGGRRRVLVRPCHAELYRWSKRGDRTPAEPRGSAGRRQSHIAEALAGLPEADLKVRTTTAQVQGVRLPDATPF